jgi:hypothetical protein
MWEHGFEEAKRRWKLACQWKTEGGTTKVQPSVREQDTSGSRPTEVGVSGASSSTDPARTRFSKIFAGVEVQHVLPSEYVTQEEAAEKQRTEGTLYPWANIPTGYKPEIREEDSQPEVIDLEEDDPGVNPCIPSKKVDSPWDWWNYPIDAGVYG